MQTGGHYDETITLPRAVRFPVELVPPPGFDPERLETWPSVTGRLEFVEGRLLYMPPCSDVQQDTVTDVVITLGAWVRTHAGFVLGSNEAGMRLSGSTRAADAAIWKRDDLGPYTGRLRRRAPILVVEVAGTDEDEPESQLRDKARWYLGEGVAVVWIVLPETREVVVVTSTDDVRCAKGDRLPAQILLPDLEPIVDDLFRQIDGG